MALRLLVFGGRHARDVLEIFAERRLGVEIERIGHLLDVFVGETKHVLGFEYHKLVDPGRGRASGRLLYDMRQIFRRYEKFVGVESYRAFVGVMKLNEIHKLMHIVELARLRLLRVLGIRPCVIFLELKHLVDYGLDERPGYVLGKKQPRGCAWH